MPRRRKTPKEDASSSSAAPDAGEEAQRRLDQLQIAEAPQRAPQRPILQAPQPAPARNIRAPAPAPAPPIPHAPVPARPAPAPAPISQPVPARNVQPPAPAPAPTSVPARNIQQPAPAPAPHGQSPISHSPQPVVATPAAQQPAAPSSSRAVSFPRRPGFGALGTKYLVNANHFLLRFPNKDFLLYDVTITPEVKSRAVNKAVMRHFVTHNRGRRLGGCSVAFDGRKILYASGKLPFTSEEFEVPMATEEISRTFKVKITYTSTIAIDHLRRFLAGRQADIPQEALQAFDIVMREVPFLRFTPVGRSFFSPLLGQRALGSGLDGWKGFFQSVRPTQMGMSLNIDISATAFIQELPVIDYVSQSLRRNLDRPLSDGDKAKVRRLLRSLKVEVTHRGDMRRTYRVSGITPVTTRELTFPVDERGTMQSVVNYFKERYKYTIRYPFLPSLLVGSTERANYLPMEVCKIAKRQRYPRRLDESQVSSLRQLACPRPSARENDIRRCVTENGYNTDDYIEGFGISVDTNETTVEARRLPVPVLKYHEAFQPPLGRWNMANKKMADGATVNHWACINFSARVNAQTLSAFCAKLRQTCVNSGMKFNPQPIVPPSSFQPESVECAIQQVPEQTQLLLVILPENNGRLYGDVKRICETGRGRCGIISQCCLETHVSKMNIQYLANVALKINAKVGGRNVVLQDALCNRIRLITEVPTIIFGADVTHPQAGEDSSPSIAAVVASQDWPEITKYAGVVRAQTHRKEIIEDLYHLDTSGKVPQHGGMIRELLLCFYQATKQKPHRIVFYRDGVSEGQFQQVLREELDAIKKACASLEANYKPTVTFVVVQKRHHTRLFPADPRNGDRSGNVLQGTVVDTKICHPIEFDFYLCSHVGLQGTSRPAHYHVLWDENGFTADGLQKFTNDLCYTYARATTPVSYVPPAYYAHLAAFRARFYMPPEATDTESVAQGRSRVCDLPPVKDNLKNLMFYC